jgi:branched-chain amino acid transport system substrate-binding protein
VLTVGNDPDEARVNKNGVDLAVKEINASGGVLGRKFEITTLDNQSNAGVAKALAHKAVDMGAFAVIGRRTGARWW